MFRRPKVIILTAALLYAVALGVAWQQGTDWAEKRIRLMLEAAETGYSDVINGEIDAALRNVGGAIINIMGGKFVPLPESRMQELAKTFNIDEINIVDRRGVAVSSNLRSVLGFDFTTNSRTAAFMALTNAHSRIVSQPFRNGIANPELRCKYYGLPFPDREGFLQMGVSFEHLRQNMYDYTDEDAARLLKEWHFSVRGWYVRADHDPDYESGKIFRRWCDDCQEDVVGRYFAYGDFLYAAVLPSSYCYSQRNAFFVITALVLTVLISIFTLILIRLAKASTTLEKLHAAAEARTAADLALAKTIQMSALPACEGAFMDQLEFTFMAESMPAREVGGDFYDFYAVSGGRIVFLVADVSGKGIPGAMFMMEAKNILKNCLTEFADAAEAVTEANRRICEKNRAELFVTAWIGVLDPKIGTMEYVNAGHNRPFVRRADGTVEKVMGKGGRFLGMFEDATYRVNVLKLGKGDILFLYTDGITEAMNERGEQFGEARLCASLTGYNRDIYAALRQFVGKAEQSDDLTGLKLYWTGRPRRTMQMFPCCEDSLGAAVDFIRAALDSLDRKTVAAVLNAADEITSNIVNYSGAVDYRISVERGYDRLRLSFSDSGKPYNPLSHVDPDTHAAIEDRPVGGLGLVVVKRLADRVTYAREGERNVLTIIKKV